MDKKVENHIRSFGMSGFLITDELKNIEKKFNIKLGHDILLESLSEANYYPQFEQNVRTEASKMARYYELFYCLEKSIRKLIAETLQESAGSDWWESGKIPPEIGGEVSKRIQQELDSGVTMRSDDPIDYTTFGELSVIITNNWDLFATIFSSKRAVEKIMRSLNMLRGPIAHCCPISEDEILRLKLTVKDWFRIMA
jgi:hypothetical protein